MGGKKHRTAFCFIINKSTHHVLSTKLIHKYSDVYKDIFKQNPIQISAPNERVGSEILNFNTGNFTTGQDWFYLRWISIDPSNGKCYFHETNPNNFRWLFDAAEKVISFDDVVQKQSLGFVSESVIFNIESTVGFKKHVLRKIDSKNDNDVVIGQDQVYFCSKSGNSSVPYTTKSLNLPLLILMNKIQQMDQMSSQQSSENYQSLQKYNRFINQLIKNMLSLPTTQRNDEDLTCCICLENVCINSASRHQGICRSLFHYDCIIKWKHSTCPMCRVDFSTPCNGLVKINDFC